jgi:hypothetical protein
MESGKVGGLVEAHHFRDGVRSGEGSQFCVANVKIQLECYNHRYQGFHQCCHEMAAYQAMARMRIALMRLDADKDAVCMNGRQKSNKPYTLKERRCQRARGRFRNFQISHYSSIIKQAAEPVKLVRKSQMEQEKWFAPRGVWVESKIDRCYRMTSLLAKMNLRSFLVDWDGFGSDGH